MGAAKKPGRNRSATRNGGPQRQIDATDFVESRRTWEPDPATMEKELEAINRELLRIYAKPQERNRSSESPEKGSR